MIDGLPWALRIARWLAFAQGTFALVLGGLCVVGGRDYRPVNPTDPRDSLGLVVFGVVFALLGAGLSICAVALRHRGPVPGIGLVSIEAIGGTLGLVGLTGPGLSVSAGALAVIVLVLMPARSRRWLREYAS